MDGFLGTRASLMLDVVFLAMFGVIPVMLISIALVKYRRRYGLHKRIQVTLGTILLLAVTAFEVDMRINGWEDRAIASPYYNAEATLNTVATVLYVHLVFAVSTAVLWVVVIVQALRKFPSPPAPGAHSAFHLRWAKLAAADMVATAVTGWVFYWLAFVAEAPAPPGG